MADITVTRGADVEHLFSSFAVTVTEDDGSTRHTVTLSSADFERLAGDRSPEDFIRASFDFLLEREPKGSILPSFDVADIATYFPEFERRIQGL